MAGHYLNKCSFILCNIDRYPRKQIQYEKSEYFDIFLLENADHTICN